MNFCTRQSEHRLGFTLVELLLVMAIITVLATLSLVVIGEAQYDARRNATQARINVIDKILQQRLEDYQVRPNSLRNLASYVDYSSGNQNNDPRMDTRDLNRRIVTDVINVEMPRSLLNIAFQPGMPGSPMDATYPSRRFVEWADDYPDLVFSQDTGNFVTTDLAARPPALAVRFVQYNDNAMPANPLAQPQFYPEGDLPNNLNEIQRRRANSEYLYIVLETTEFNGLQGTTSLGNRAFADTDGDGFQEVVDSWGDPIVFRFQMYTDQNSNVPALEELDPGFDPAPNVPAIPIRNIRIVIESTGNGVELITN